MDPWQPCPNDNNIEETNLDGLVLHNGDNSHERDPAEHKDSIQEISSENSLQNSGGDLTFGDNFRPFVKLPDSEEYLDSLQKKLKKIQKGGPKGPSADSILRSLEQTKESCMIKLLSNSVEQLTAEGEIFEELRVNPLLKKLAPERQALSTEELVHLLKADQLEIILHKKEEEEELPGSSSLSETTLDSIEIVPEAGGSEEEVEKDKDKSQSQEEPNKAVD